MVTTRSSTPLPALPLELKHEVLKFCDPSTLAQTSRVSLAFLELSSPLLYRDITVDGLVGLRRLLVKRDSLAQPHLAPYLDLSSHSSFNLGLFDFDSEELLNISLDRIPSSGQISVEKLVLGCPSPTTEPDLEQNDRVQALSDQLLPLFNPRRVELVGKSQGTSSFPLVDLVPTPWPKLERLALLGPVSILNYWGQSGFLNVGSEQRRIEMVVDPGWEEDEASTSLGLQDAAFKDILLDLTTLHLTSNILQSPRLKRLVVVLPSKEEEALVRGQVDDKWPDDALREEWRSRLVFEVSSDAT